MSECPGCGNESNEWDSSLSAQFSGNTKAMICAYPSCPVLHFKDSPRVLQ